MPNHNNWGQLEAHKPKMFWTIKLFPETFWRIGIITTIYITIKVKELWEAGSGSWIVGSCMQHCELPQPLVKSLSKLAVRPHIENVAQDAKDYTGAATQAHRFLEALDGKDILMLTKQVAILPHCASILFTALQWRATKQPFSTIIRKAILCHI